MNRIFVPSLLCSVSLFPCLQVFALSLKGELRREEGCCDALGEEGSKVRLMQCHGMTGNQFWTHNKVRRQVDGQIIQHVLSVSVVSSDHPQLFSLQYILYIYTHCIYIHICVYIHRYIFIYLYIYSELFTSYFFQIHLHNPTTEMSTLMQYQQ